MVPWLFGFKASKARTQCQLGVARIKLLRNKKTIQVRCEQKTESARARVRERERERGGERERERREDTSEQRSN
jgi:hypothetical protein